MTVRVAEPDPSEVETANGADTSDDAELVEMAEMVAPVDPSPVRSRHPFTAGALGATWAVCVGLGLMAVFVMLFWAISPNTVGDSGAAWRAVGLTWLGAQLVPLSVSGLPVSVLPLAAVLPALLLARRGGGWAARLVAAPDGREMRALLGGAALTYGAAGAVVAWLCSSGATGAKPAQAFLGTAAVCAAGTLWGIGREIDLLGRVRDRVSAETWLTLVAGWTALVSLFALGIGLVVLGLLAGFGDAVANLASLQGGIVAGIGMTLLGLLTLPTLAVWAVALAAGPGFTVGSLGSASAFGGTIATLPAVPVLAAIPSSVPAWAPVLLLGPVACGVLAGRVRWREDLPSWPGAILAGLGVGAVVAPVVAVAVLLTSGSLGGGRLDRIGPELGPVTGAVVGLVILGFLIDAGVQTAWLAWELRAGQAHQEPSPTESDDPAPAESAESSQAGPPVEPDETTARTGRRDRSLATAITGLGSAARGSALWAAGQANSAAGALSRRAAAEPEAEQAAAPSEAEPADAESEDHVSSGQDSADEVADDTDPAEKATEATVATVTEDSDATAPNTTEDPDPAHSADAPLAPQPLPAWLDETAELDLSALYVQHRPADPADPASGAPTDTSEDDK